MCNINCGPMLSTATLNCLKSTLDEAFPLFVDMLRNPGIQGDKIEIFGS